jgi:transposase-like protein
MEFKTKAVILAGKHEKPVRQAAVDLGINENVLYRWMQRAREAAETGLPPLPGHGRPRDEEPAHLGKENKVLREALWGAASLEILKKAAGLWPASSSFRTGETPLTA